MCPHEKLFVLMCLCGGGWEVLGNGYFKKIPFDGLRFNHRCHQLFTVPRRTKANMELKMYIASSPHPHSLLSPLKYGWQDVSI